MTAEVYPVFPECYYPARKKKKKALNMGFQANERNQKRLEDVIGAPSRTLSR